ncbi:hypothetical protein HDU97_001584, partial [Phlyctochytrium planicorne]
MHIFLPSSSSLSSSSASSPSSPSSPLPSPSPSSMLQATPSTIHCLDANMCHSPEQQYPFYSFDRMRRISFKEEDEEYVVRGEGAFTLASPSISPEIAKVTVPRLDGSGTGKGASSYGAEALPPPLTMTVQHPNEDGARGRILGSSQNQQ